MEKRVFVLKSNEAIKMIAHLILSANEDLHKIAEDLFMQYADVWIQSEWEEIIKECTYQERIKKLYDKEL